MIRLTLTTDLGIIKENARRIREKIAPGVKMLSVVKADAYGHGSAEVARALEESGLNDFFAVATADEGVYLRKSGIRSRILILGLSSEEEMEAALLSDLSVTVDSKEALLLVNEMTKKAGKSANVHLKIDTGMHRIGIKTGEALSEILTLWKNLSSVRMEGVFSHFSSAGLDEEYTEKQFSDFLSACRMISDSGFKPIRHIAASSALCFERYQMDMVRAGIALYGVGDASLKGCVRPAQTLKTHPVRLFTVKKGEKVGYSMNFSALRDTTVMTIPCGYGDGYPRILGNRASVLVNGRRAPIIGNICMDMLMADVTDAGDVSAESEVVLLGSQGNETISPEELSALSSTIPYEIMLGFSNRVTKKWIDESLGGLP